MGKADNGGVWGDVLGDTERTKAGGASAQLFGGEWPDGGALAASVPVYKKDGDEDRDENTLAAYIHFPYCRSRCPYCDFFRGILPRDFDEAALLQRYADDMAAMARLCGGRRITSVFFGGGTPSLLSPAAVEQVLNWIGRHFSLSPAAEISLEANPNTFERGKFLDFRTAGVNRLSLGVQALNKADLRFLGRTHSLDDALRAMELGAAAFPKFSIDLIYARPNQQWDDWQKEIDTALSFGLKHISLYELSIEEGTPFFKKNIRGADEESALNLYQQTVSYLRGQGLERYEVSNFAASAADECAHNLVYWRGGDYLGLGTGAHGRLTLTDTTGKRKILATVDGQPAEELTPAERAEELVLLGLRLKEGISAARFYQACGIKLFDFLSENATKRLAQLNLLCYDDGNIKLTDKGFPLLDEIILELVS